MKNANLKSMLIGLLTLSASQALARPIEVTRVLKDTTTLVALDLNSTTVFCTDRGYGNIQLKISVPELDWLAHFDHRVAGEGLPCITGGRCSPENSPEKLIDPNERFVLAQVNVVLSETLVIDSEKHLCSQQLNEQIQTLIKGRKFSHFRHGELMNPAFEKCEKLMPH